MKYLLDTNVIVDLLRRTSPKLDSRIISCDSGDIVLSAIVLHELYYGAFKSRLRSAGLAALDRLHFQILDFNREDARQAGEIRALLADRGAVIGPFDTLIAGQALARNLTLITRNTREFSRVPNLRMEDWQSESTAV
jgi:tRNA(fMet)-specific endonuclease VapC